MEKKNLKAWYFHLLTDFTTGISLNISFAGNHYQNGQIGFMGALNNSFVLPPISFMVIAKYGYPKLGFLKFD